MDEDRNFLRRFGGHLALIFVVILLFFGLRSVSVSRIFDFGLDPLEQTSNLSESSRQELSEGAAVNIESPAVFDISNVPVLFDSGLSPRLDPITFQGTRPEHEFVTYTVKPNDTPIGIASSFGIKTETLLGGNAFLSEEASAMQPGMELKVLPIDGVLHDVAEGDTLESISELYGIPIEDIIAYESNRLEFPYRLYPGTQIMVPGAVREVFIWTAPSPPTRPSTSDSTGSGISPLIQGTGTFIWPIPQRRITQHYWYGHQAIDIGTPEGTAVVASDTGTVTWAGWNVYGYGNLIVINHGNGYETYYAHLSGINVQPGQIVYQGNPIGASGNTGRSSGPHLHFEIRFYNTMYEPLSYLR